MMALALLLALAAPSGALEAAPPRFVVDGEVGPEYDSNARRRARDEDPEPSGLVRATANGSMTLTGGGGQALFLSYGAGGKLFFNEEGRGSDELVQRAALNGSLPLTRRNWGTTRLGLVGNYYDSFQRESERDFRHGRGGLLGSGTYLSWGGNLGLAYQGLQFKPDAEFSFHGPLITLGLSRTLISSAEATWRIGFSHALAVRTYEGQALDEPRECPPDIEPDDPDALCQAELSDQRQDIDNFMRLQVDYFGSAFASLWYALDINASNSYGESYTRHIIGLKFTMPLIWDIFLTGKGIIQVSAFHDPLFGRLKDRTFVDIDDENRSSLIVYLSRDITDLLALSFRYSVYLSESSSTSDGQSVAGFLRHTVFLGLRFHYDTQDGV